jgi:hypothetical protein
MTTDNDRTKPDSETSTPEEPSIRIVDVTGKQGRSFTILLGPAPPPEFAVVGTGEVGEQQDGDDRAIFACNKTAGNP